MVPIMYLLQGTLWEKPQRTHFWNNQKFTNAEAARYNLPGIGVYVEGDKQAKSPYLFGFIPLFHMPIFGGWRKFVVLTPAGHGPWHIGWYTDHGFVGASRVTIHGPIRMTIGPGGSRFFALDMNGQFLPLMEVDQGLIGEAGDFRRIPLL